MVQSTKEDALQEHIFWCNAPLAQGGGHKRARGDDPGTKYQWEHGINRGCKEYDWATFLWGWWSCSFFRPWPWPWLKHEKEGYISMRIWGKHTELKLSIMSKRRKVDLLVSGKICDYRSENTWGFQGCWHVLPCLNASWFNPYDDLLQGCGQGGFLPEKLDGSLGKHGRQRGPVPRWADGGRCVFFWHIGAEGSWVWMILDDFVDGPVSLNPKSHCF